MAELKLRALSLRALRDRLQILEVYLVPSPPAPDGMMYFVGNKPGYFPYKSGPIRYLRSRDLDELIPAHQVRSLLRHLEITEAQFASTEGGLGTSISVQIGKPN